MSDPVLQVRNFTVEFWVDGSWYPAAVDMNFDVQAGKTLAIVGESGSGKSTTAMGIMDLLASNARMSGSVKVKGSEMIGVPKSQLRKFRGREVAHPELGAKILDAALEQLGSLAKVETQARLEGRNMTMVLSPDKKPAKKSSDKDEPQESAPVVENVVQPEETSEVQE